MYVYFIYVYVIASFIYIHFFPVQITVMRDGWLKEWPFLRTWVLNLKKLIQNTKALRNIMLS